MQFIPQSHVVRFRHATLGKALPEDVKRIVTFEAKQERLIIDAFDTFLDECRSDEVASKFGEAYSKSRMIQAVDVTDQAIANFSRVLVPVFNNAGKFETNWLYHELDINQVKKIDVSPNIDLSFDPGSAEAARSMRNSLLQFIREMTDAQRKAIRTVLAQALQQGLSPIEAARLFRSKIGLTQFQMGAVDKYRNLLQNGSSEALSRTLRDRRFDSTIGRAIDQGVQLSTTQIERMVGRYQERMLTMRAETIARTEMLSTVNAARHTATIQMANKVDLEMGRIQRTWRCVMDTRTRDTHLAMNRQVRGAEEPFVSPSGAKLMYPGDRSAPAAEVINCRCVTQVKILPPGESTAISQPVRTPLRPTTPPPVYQNLNTAHVDDFADGFITFADNDVARTAFTQLNTQVADVLRKVEAAQIAEADEILAAALKSAEALELAEAKAAKKYTDVVRAAAKDRGITSTSIKTIGNEKVATSAKYDYGVPSTVTKPPKGSGKNKDLFIAVKTKEELTTLAREMYEESLKRPLTSIELETIQRYTGSQYEAINKLLEKRLRSSKPLQLDPTLPDFEGEFIKILDDVFSRTRLTEDIMVFRGMGADRFLRTFSGALEGQIVILDKAFLSTSMSRDFAANWYLPRANQKPFVVEIMVPKGSSALAINPISRVKGEYEVLLNRGSKFIVHSISSNKAVLELLP